MVLGEMQNSTSNLSINARLRHGTAPTSIVPHYLYPPSNNIIRHETVSIKRQVLQATILRNN